MDTSSGAQYASGGSGSGSGSGSGAGGGLGNSLANLFGGGNSGGTGAGVGADETRFGRKLAGTGDVPPMISSDPDDYFSRISADTNLFKIVERRYQKNSLQWAKDRSAELVK